MSSGGSSPVYAEALGGTGDPQPDKFRTPDGFRNDRHELKQVRAVEAPGVTHLKYRVVT
jgi:hypothetical protein